MPSDLVVFVVMHTFNDIYFAGLYGDDKRIKRNGIGYLPMANSHSQASYRMLVPLFNC